MSIAPHFKPERVLHDGRGRRDLLVGGGGGEHHEVDLIDSETGPFDGEATGLDRELGRDATDTPFVDAGAFDDPLVRRVHHRCEVVVGEHLSGSARPQPVIRAPRAPIVVIVVLSVRYAATRSAGSM